MRVRDLTRIQSSLKKLILLNGDPYPEQLNKTAELIAERANLNWHNEL